MIIIGKKHSSLEISLKISYQGISIEDRIFTT